MKKLQGTLTLIAMTATTSGLTAETVDLSHLHLPILQTLSITEGRLSGYRETSIHIDKNKIAHIRMQQTWGGYPVWGTEAVLHTPQIQTHHKTLTARLAHPIQGAHMNGTAYRKLQNDLTLPPTKVFSAARSQYALQNAISLYKQKTGTHFSIQNQSIQRIVFVDKENKAHWAWQIRFTAHTPHLPPTMPTFIMDASTYTIYKQWDNLQTLHAAGGGYGGNPQMGKLTYDGLAHNLPRLEIERDEDTQKCYLKNDEVIVEDRHDEMTEDTLSEFLCVKKDSKHNLTYWDGNLNSSNGGYSPDNDALFIGHVVQNLYKDWYGIPALQEQGKPMKLIMRVHDFEYPNNAFWDGQEMTFSDGGSEFYPFTILNIGAHEISHGFTEQNANLVYEGQSGGLNESFSDMASAAADFYAYGKNSWQLGKEISKNGEKAFRRMDFPSKDCDGDTPGHYCSIDKASQYNERLNVHFSSGVFNRAFYLLATSQGWDTHKAFDVMVKANQDYWIATSTFQQAACGVMNAATDLKYDTTAISKAFLDVDLDTTKC